MQVLRSAAGSCAALAALPAAIFAERWCNAGSAEGNMASASSRQVLHWQPSAAAVFSEPLAMQSAAVAGASSLQDSMLQGRGDPRTKRGKVLLLISLRHHHPQCCLYKSFETKPLQIGTIKG